MQATRVSPAVPAESFSLKPVLILVGIVIAALVISSVALAPIYPVNFSQTDEVDLEGYSSLNLDVIAEIAEINVIASAQTGKAVSITTSVTGSRGIFGSAEPFDIAFNHTGTNELRAIYGILNRDNFFSNLNVVCNVYVDPSLNLSLRVQSTVGQVKFSSDVPVTIEKLDFDATTGNLQASLAQDVILAGDVSLRTTTGNIQFRMNQADVVGNVSVDARSTTGNIDLNITRYVKLNGNVEVNAQATTGQVNLDLAIDGDVGARIESQTSIGRITVDVERFSGNQSLIQSNNYPAASNFNFNFKTTVGNINLRAAYLSSTTAA